MRRVAQRTIERLWREAVSAGRTTPAYLVESGDEWTPLSWEEAGRRVEDYANGLLSLGVRKGDAFSLIGVNSVHWALLDFALGTIGAIAAPIYANSSAKDAGYILDHSEAVGVLVDDEAKQATVIVPDDQLSLAIGKDGLNARLAARLTGWRVDIRSETEFAEEESEMCYAEEDVSGRCACILANGKRCPNASLPGSRYCGLPAHQALEGQETDYVVPPEEGEEPEGEEPSGDEDAAEETAVDLDAPSAEELVEDADALETEAEVEDGPAAEELLDEEDAAELDEEPAEEEPAEEEPSVEEVLDAAAAAEEEEES